MKHLIPKSLVVILFSFVLPVLSDASRHIHINGEHLSHENIMLLDKIVGNAVESGYYWLNMQTGEWGYQEHEQVQGVIASIANQQNQNLRDQQQNNSEYSNQADSYNNWEGVSGTGSVTSGQLNGQNCTFVSVAGTTIKSCD
jgi:hypothetical protein